MGISLAVSVRGKFKSLRSVCPSLRMHVSIRFWKAPLVLLPVSFPFYGTWMDALIHAVRHCPLVAEIHATVRGSCPIQLPARRR
jgi:hypothetical protein